MFLINITFALCIIGTIFLAIGINIKNKIVRNIGIAIFSIVIIFWIWFFSWFFIDEDEELKSKMGEETTNNVSESTRGEDITSQVISNDSSIYKYGIIRKIKDDKITFINKENNIDFSRNIGEFVLRYSLYNPFFIWYHILHTKHHFYNKEEYI